MSRINDLKNNPEFQFNLIEMLEVIAPIKKTKYVELLLKLLKHDEYIVTAQQSMKDNLGMIDEDFAIFKSKFRKSVACFIMSTIVSVDEYLIFEQFCEGIESKVIKQTDITKYKTHSEIAEAVNDVRFRIEEHELEKQTFVIFEDNEWLIIRPLTYQSSVKYGYGTQWCTASRDSDSYFPNYAGNGILIYVINKLTNLKVAVHKDDQTSFWNAEDTRIDSFDSGLPYDVLVKIMSHITEEPRTNIALYNEKIGFVKKIEEKVEVRSMSGTTF
jgi:hypothetical protein